MQNKETYSAMIVGDKTFSLRATEDMFVMRSTRCGASSYLIDIARKMVLERREAKRGAIQAEIRKHGYSRPTPWPSK